MPKRFPYQGRYLRFIVPAVPTLRQRIEENPRELQQMVNFPVHRMTGRERPDMTGRINDNHYYDVFARE
ncbi:hypothetical protein D3OALGA1CA_5748 [Olavius algarvensis associated proteobacterium Delta 3]|nr:hypothetical protein D3OALGB2SA_2426 [Olavius algarvensis associated proteobacterium Delta 3]CAB5171219.1 hypothetical protein D3OALGA1CA_5748 [Olavius algarvensis associated proteobacterium Delta 3]